MTIEQRLSVIENNLNAYGQWDVTQTEWNALKINEYSCGCLEGIKLGRKNAIAEVIAMKENADGCLDCAFESAESWELPCRQCKRNAKDYWRKKVEA